VPNASALEDAQRQDHIRGLLTARGSPNPEIRSKFLLAFFRTTRHSLPPSRDSIAHLLSPWLASAAGPREIRRGDFRILNKSVMDGWIIRFRHDAGKNVDQAVTLCLSGVASFTNIRRTDIQLSYHHEFIRSRLHSTATTDGRDTIRLTLRQPFESRTKCRRHPQHRYLARRRILRIGWAYG
jgi:hypothetical protein